MHGLRLWSGGKMAARVSRKSLSSTVQAVFDRSLKRRQREWAANTFRDDEYDYLREAVANRLVERLDDILRDFEIALDLGCHKGFIWDAMTRENSLSSGRGIGGIKKLIQSDMADFGPHITSKLVPENRLFDSEFIHQDEERMVWEPESYNLVLSSLWLHWANDIPRLLRNIHTSLKPDGAFMATMLGGSTLEEFRHSFYLAELERTGGVSPHMSPLVRPSDAAALLQGAGFSLPTVDVDTITVHYPNAFVLMEHVARMGEGIASNNRRIAVGRESFLAMAAIYQDTYGEEDGSIPVTYQIIDQVISMIGWKPHESQQKPLRRGSAAKSLKDITGGVTVDRSR